MAFDEERILPSQWEIPTRPETGERRLMRAILEQSLHDLKLPDSPHFQETVDWFASEDVSYLYSFENICGILGFDSGIVRREVASRGVAIARSIRPRWASSRPRVTVNEPVSPRRGSPFSFKNRGEKRGRW